MARVFNEDDRMVQATLLLVGTAMVAFHIAYEKLYWRETQCILEPPALAKNDPRAWDPRSDKDGVPPEYSWFGLPSMWFTSQQAYDDLRLWTTLSRKEHHQDGLVKLHAEEIALYALKPEGAAYLRNTLSNAKLFSMGQWKFLKRDDEQPNPRDLEEGEVPESLSMSFVFYDRGSEQFLQPGEEYQGGLMRLLTRTGSNLSSGSNRFKMLDDFDH